MTPKEQLSNVQKATEAYEKSKMRISKAIEDKRVARLAWQKNKNEKTKATYDRLLNEHKAAIAEIQGTRDAWKKARAAEASKVSTDTAEAA